MKTALVIITVLAVGALHFVLSRQRVKWLGAVVPTIWVFGVAFFMQRGVMDRPFDYGMAVFGLFTLLGVWADGQKAVSRRAAHQTAASEEST